MVDTSDGVDGFISLRMNDEWVGVGHPQPRLP